MKSNNNSTFDSDFNHTPFHELPEHKRHTALLITTAVLLAILAFIVIYHNQVSNTWKSLFGNKSSSLTDEERAAIIMQLQNSTAEPLSEKDRKAISESLAKDTAGNSDISEEDRKAIINELQNAPQ